MVYKKKIGIHMQEHGEGASGEENSREKMKEKQHIEKCMCLMI